MATPTVLRLDGEISETSARLLREAIEAVPASNRIELRIASPGGSIFDGKTLLTALGNHAGGVDTTVESLAASMASALFMAGEKRKITKGSRLMIHRPWISSAAGESADLRKSADLLDSLESDLLAAFGKTGIGQDQLKQMLADETWMTADEALAMGFATEIAGELRGAIPQHFLNKFSHVPQDLKEEMSAEADVAPVDVADVVLPAPQSKASLQARVKTLSGELLARTTERDNARAQLAKTKFLLSALERSYGLSAAQRVIAAPAVGELVDALEQFESITDPNSRARFYEKNKAAIMAAHDARKFGNDAV